jgi:hypothetical protein
MVFSHGLREVHGFFPWFWFLIHGFGGVPHLYKEALPSLYVWVGYQWNRVSCFYYLLVYEGLVFVQPFMCG